MKRAAWRPGPVPNGKTSGMPPGSRVRAPLQRAAFAALRGAFQKVSGPFYAAWSVRAAARPVYKGDPGRGSCKDPYRVLRKTLTGSFYERPLQGPSTKNYVLLRRTLTESFSEELLQSPSEELLQSSVENSLQSSFRRVYPGYPAVVPEAAGVRQPARPAPPTMERAKVGAMPGCHCQAWLSARKGILAVTARIPPASRARRTHAAPGAAAAEAYASLGRSASPSSW